MAHLKFISAVKIKEKLIEPIPADRPTGLTLNKNGEACLSQASWSAPPLPASARMNGGDLGENGFGSVYRR